MSLKNTFRRSIWPTADLIGAVSSKIYSNRRNDLESPLLKYLLSIFPYILKDVRDSQSLTLGDSLLDFLRSRVDQLNDILIYHLDQTMWLLERGDKQLKEEVILYWLQSSDLDILVKALACSNNCLILDDLLKNEYLNETVAQR